VKTLFDALDDNGNGTLEPDELILPLLAMGISPDSKFIGKSLMTIYKTNDLSEIKIKRDEFTNIFRGDVRTDYILETLNNHC
jgi:hypothetical protein